MPQHNRNVRQNAIKKANESSFLSGFEPSEFGMSVYEKWIAGELDVSSSIVLLIEYHKSLEIAPGSSSDQKALPNKLGITDLARLKVAEADITTLRMAELLAENE